MVVRDKRLGGPGLLTREEWTRIFPQWRSGPREREPRSEGCQRNADQDQGDRCQVMASRPVLENTQEHVTTPRCRIHGYSNAQFWR